MLSMLAVLLCAGGLLFIAIFRLERDGVVIPWTYVDGVVILKAPKVLAIPATLNVQVAKALSAQLIENPIVATAGRRIGGSSFRGLRLGSFRGSTGLCWWAATTDRPAVRIETRGGKYDYVLVTVADPDALIRVFPAAGASIQEGPLEDGSIEDTQIRG